MTFRKASQGFWQDGSLVGWRGSKSWFPLPLDKVAYPGGYPNAEGYNMLALASGALALTLECSVGYDRPDKPGGKKPTRTYSFSELVDVTWVALGAFLEDGLERPFVNRGPEKVYRD